MTDELADDGFEVPRLARLYDPLDPDRSDLDAYVAIVDDASGQLLYGEKPHAPELCEESVYGMPEIFNSDQGGQFTRPGQSGLGGRHHVHPDGLRLGQLVRDRRARSSPGR